METAKRLIRFEFVVSKLNMTDHSRQTDTEDKLPYIYFERITSIFALILSTRELKIFISI